MTVEVGSNPQVTVAPRCPACGSADTYAQRSQGCTLEHEGERCRAQKQYRICRACRANFGAVLIKGRVDETRQRVTGPWTGLQKNSN